MQYNQGNISFTKILGNTLVSPDRLKMIKNMISQIIVNKFGAINAAEIGVYKGGTSKLILECLEKYTSKKNTFMIFDTFEGLPDSTKDVDLHKIGDFNDTSLEAVREYLSGYKNTNLTITKGIFPDSFPQDKKDMTFDFVHLDVDQYQSYKNCLEFFNTRMSEGGIIVCDDYGFCSCPGAKKAIDEFCMEKNIKYLQCETKQAILFF
ncbi:MAG: class I SAM-dependent methyltransferase [Thermoplasmatales archaeon]|nr:MAG: class I SAM-dependent methyltransferase [Thermoplasmatales archaeon]